MTVRLTLAATAAIVAVPAHASAQQEAKATSPAPDASAVAAAHPIPAPPSQDEVSCFDQLRAGRSLRKPPAANTTVSIGIDIIDIREIDGATETFSIDFYLIARWSDPRLSRPGLEKLECILDPAEVWPPPGKYWNPKLEFINMRSEDRNDNQTVELFGDGSAEYSARISGVFDADFDLHEFPFDSQTLSVQIESGHDATKVTLAPIHELSGDSGKNWWREIPQWRIDNLSTTESKSYWVSADAKFSRFTLAVDAQRRYGFYIWKVLVPLFLIIFLSWTVFWMSSDHFGDQMAVSITCLLALIAFNFVIGDELPKISYQTVLDWAILLAYIFVFFAAVQNVLVHYFVTRDRADTASRIEVGSRWLFPVTYLVTNALLVILLA